MSMEDAIKELAEAIRYAADRFNGTGIAAARVAGMPASMAAPYGDDSKYTSVEAERADKDAIAKAEQPVKRTNKTAEAVAQNAVKADSELEQAVQKVEAEAKAAPAEPELVELETKDISASDVALDYSKDVKPVLLELFKKKGADALGGLLAKHLPGVAKPKGDMLKAEQLGAVLAEANAILAG